MSTTPEPRRRGRRRRTRRPGRRRRTRPPRRPRAGDRQAGPTDRPVPRDRGARPQPGHVRPDGHRRRDGEHRHQGQGDADVHRATQAVPRAARWGRQCVSVHVDHRTDRDRARAGRSPAVARSHRRPRHRAGRAEPGRRRGASHPAPRRRIHRAGQRVLGDRRRRRAQHGSQDGRHQARRFLCRRTLPARRRRRRAPAGPGLRAYLLRCRRSGGGAADGAAAGCGSSPRCTTRRVPRSTCIRPKKIYRRSSTDASAASECSAHIG